MLGIKNRATPKFKAILRDAGFRATKQRLALLMLLGQTAGPISVKAVAQRMKSQADFVTVYRALEALAGAGIVTRVDLRHSHAHYELAVGMAHHHHLVCNSCGEIEDIHECPLPTLQKKALRGSTKFASVQNHALELFGICNKCV